MKRLLVLFLVIYTPVFCLAHIGGHGKAKLKHWHLLNPSNTIEASFLFCKNNIVYLENNKHEIIHFPIGEFSKSDQKIIYKQIERIEKINQVKNISIPVLKKDNTHFINFWIIISVLIIIIPIAIKHYSKFWHRWFPLSIILLAILFSFKQKHMALFKMSNRISFLDSAFAPFVPHVHTFSDSKYYYVESQGIPSTHPMMTGISNHGWQQQVPIPQCYLGNNAWPIPLFPELATTPIPVDSIHFTRGAIAIAVNGIPIFNVHTNTGVDSYLDGQLDNYGGHCGRADDYHYHIAPTHLYDYTSTHLPIAYGLDGFPVYGLKEPDGSNMQTLDANHGHLGMDGMYHYHGTTSAPYMIARMAGKVTEDTTHQLIPQAAAHPVRPGLTPLKGALIQYVKPNGSNNGYTLVYTLNNQTDSIVYSWTTNGKYTFTFYTEGSSPTTQVYNGFIPCKIPSTFIHENWMKEQILIYPNPTHDFLRIQFFNPALKSKIISMHITDLNGRCLNEWNECKDVIDISEYSSGIYVIQLQTSNGFIVSKFQIK